MCTRIMLTHFFMSLRPSPHVTYDLTRHYRFLSSQPLPIQHVFRGGDGGAGRRGGAPERSKRDAEDDQDDETEEGEKEVGEDVNCDWNIRTDPGLYLLMTFHNLSAPFTVDCQGAYIEVERERNGFEARWCGNRLTTV